MGQEYFINDQTLENKVRQLLPSQGGAGAGFDLSASTQIIPIVDLTESAEGSNLREDLQRSFSFTNTNTFSVSDVATTDIISNTGYFLVEGIAVLQAGSAIPTTTFQLNDGASQKNLIQFTINNVTAGNFKVNPFSFNIFLGAGETLRVVSQNTCRTNGAFRQIADINGNLITPT